MQTYCTSLLFHDRFYFLMARLYISHAHAISAVEIAEKQGSYSSLAGKYTDFPGGFDNKA